MIQTEFEGLHGIQRRCDTHTHYAMAYANTEPKNMLRSWSWMLQVLTAEVYADCFAQGCHTSRTTRLSPGKMVSSKGKVALQDGSLPNR